MNQVRDFVLTWSRVIKAKRAHYAEREQDLWRRIYQGMTMESSILGPTTTDLLPVERELDERSWRILRAFTGETHLHEFLGIVIDAIYSLLACARPLVLDPYLEPDMPQLTFGESSASSQQQPVETVPSGSNSTAVGANPYILSSPDPIGGGPMEALNNDTPLTPPANNTFAELTPPLQEQPHTPQHGNLPRTTFFEAASDMYQPTISEQHCINEFMRPCRKILYEMIWHYLQITDEHDVGMLGIVEDLVESVAHVVDEAAKPAAETTSATEMFHNMMLGLAQDDDGRKHMDPLIDAMKKISIGTITKDRIGRAWQSLVTECRREREQEFRVHELTQPMKDKADELLESIAKMILIHDKDVMDVLNHASAIVMPYSGGFSYTLANMAKSVALGIFWDANRSAPTFDKARWHDLQHVFPYLCDLLGPLTLGRTEITTTDFEIVLESVKVNLTNFLPKSVTHTAEGRFKLAAQEDQFKAGQNVYHMSDVSLYTFNSMALVLDASYVYKKRTGVPLYMDYGRIHSEAHDVAVAVDIISTEDKPLSVRKSECTIGDLVLRFDETQHG
ncbi:hypothetical protein BJV82DRAFT_595367 [Fennellomyces sp. T-0311]|nr:hypothetical protein BJV82DRAFT_595367 [Fennellomyces sp. T-0311]